jgi:hypothetical protein
MESYRSLVAVAIAWATVACAGETRWAGTIVDSAGVTIVSNTESGLWAPGEEWTVEEELRIGVAEGSAEYQFGRVVSIAADSQGRIYVLDLLAQHVQVYSPEGLYERTLGGRGQGPGEFGSVLYILNGPGDTLLALDIRNQRVNRFAPDGTVLASLPFSMTDGIPLRLRGNRGGIVALQLRRWGSAGKPASENLEDVIVVPSEDWTSRDTLLAFPAGEGSKYRAGGPPEYNIGAREPTWDLSDDNTLVFGVSDEYRIERRSLDGDLLRVVMKPFVYRTFTDRDKDAYLNFLRRSYLQAGASPAEISEFLERNVHFSEQLPAFVDIVAGPAGTTWLQHAQAPSDLRDEEYEKFDSMRDGGAPGWDVFDARGRFLGVVTLPRRFQPRLFRDDKIYGVWRDELDVEYVLRLRIVGDLGVGTT